MSLIYYPSASCSPFDPLCGEPTVATYGEKQILQNHNSESNKFFGCANRLSNPSEGHFIYYFSSYFLGNNKNIHYICTVVIEVLLGRWAILSYKKDVFERLSLWTTNFANSSNSHNRQMTTKRPVVRFYISFI